MAASGTGNRVPEVFGLDNVRALGYKVSAHLLYNGAENGDPMQKTTTQDLLLEASLKLISEKGYLRATTREIAHEAGVTELTLFRHFGSKEKLFEEVLNNYTFLPKLKDLLPELDHLPCEEALALLSVRFIQTLKKRKAMIRIMLAEINLYPDKIRAVYSQTIEEVHSMLAQYFKALQKKQLFRQVSPETASRVFLSVIFSYFRTEEIVRGRVITKAAMDRDVREFIDIFLNGTMTTKPKRGER
jgi:AcrR family transcriptional regulator